LADEAERLAYPEVRPVTRAGVSILNIWRHSSVESRVLAGVLCVAPLVGFVLLRRKLRAS
jgi:hypothetical protein